MTLAVALLNSQSARCTAGAILSNSCHGAQHADSDMTHNQGRLKKSQHPPRQATPAAPRCAHLHATAHIAAWTPSIPLPVVLWRARVVDLGAVRRTPVEAILWLLRLHAVVGILIISAQSACTLKGMCTTRCCAVALLLESVPARLAQCASNAAASANRARATSGSRTSYFCSSAIVSTGASGSIGTMCAATCPYLAKRNSALSSPASQNGCRIPALS